MPTMRISRQMFGCDDDGTLLIEVSEIQQPDDVILTWLIAFNQVYGWTVALQRVGYESLRTIAHVTMAEIQGR